MHICQYNKQSKHKQTTTYMYSTSVVGIYSPPSNASDATPATCVGRWVMPQTKQMNRQSARRDDDGDDVMVCWEPVCLIMRSSGGWDRSQRNAGGSTYHLVFFGWS